MDTKALFIRIGIDVGGTNTDVVCLLDTDTQAQSSQLQVLSSAKRPTTLDPKTGMVAALKAVLKDIHKQYGSSHSICITSVRIGTTHFVNAIKERSNKLSKVTVIRLCGRSSLSHQPFIDIPNDLCKIIQGPSFCVDGGYQYDGTPLSDFNSFIQDNSNNNSLNNIVENIKQNGIKSIAIVGIFSPSKNDQEIEMVNVLKNKLGKDYCKDLHITLSHEIAGLGLIERENASILNASLHKLAENTIDSFKLAMKELGINSLLYLTKNDGTICDVEQVLKYPIRTFASGPTNSMKGSALLLSNKHSKILKNGKIMVIDIGGTTSDAGLLVNGFPQLSATTVKLGDIRTNYSMPNVISIALGGGTIIKINSDSSDDINIIVGPESVGYQLYKSVCFGGDTLTFTDIALYKGWIDKKAFDSLSRLYNKKISVDNVKTMVEKMFANDKNKNKKNVLDIAANKILDKLRQLIDHVRSEKEDIDLILCGGGAQLIPKTFKCDGISNVIIPNYSEIANAVGATCNQISGEIDCIIAMAKKDRAKEIDKLKNKAIENAIRNGCKDSKNTIHIASIDEIPLAYIPGEQSKFIIKAIGDLDESIHLQNAKEWKPNETLLNQFKNDDNDSYQFDWNNINEAENKQDDNNNHDNHSASTIAKTQGNTNYDKMDETKEEKDKEKEKDVDNGGDTRQLSENGDVWTLSVQDIEYLSIGCGVLGTGGGGSPYCHKIRLIDLINKGVKINIINPDTKNTNLIDDDTNVLTSVFMGAPAMLCEKIYNDKQITGVVYQMVNWLKEKEKDKFSNKIALLSGEIGGMNGLTPLLCAGMINQTKLNSGNKKIINVIDGDFMGRAFPELQMTIPSIYGKSLIPITLEDDTGRSYILTECKDNKDAENKMRLKCVEYGMAASISLLPLKGKEILQSGLNQRVCIKYAYKLAWDIGKIISQAKLKHENPLIQVTKFIKGSKIAFHGKIIDVQRQNNAGFNTGVAVIKNLDDNSKSSNNNGDNNFIKSDIISIELQNENLVIREGNGNDKKGKIIVSVPDLIVLFDNEFNSIATENLRYGLHCYVMVLPAHELLKTKEALKVVGPKAFGYDIDYKPFGVTVQNESQSQSRDSFTVSAANKIQNLINKINIH